VSWRTALAAEVLSARPAGFSLVCLSTQVLLTTNTSPHQHHTHHRTTLVVCPVVAVIQWRQEIARYTAAGSVKV
jgi:SNF2 family DNA or RNA helicase